MNHSFQRAILATASVSLTLIAAELAARVWLASFASDDQILLYGAASDVEAIQNPRYERHHYLPFVPTANYRDGPNRHNALGFRGDEIEQPKPGGVFRIALLGGSTTYSTAIDDYRLTYPYLLQRLLREMGWGRIEVVNAGRPGEKTIGGAKRIGAQIDSVRPDVVLIMEGSNDVESLDFDLSATSAALDDMIDEARSRGSEAMIATLPPVRPANPGLERSSENIPDLNMAIRSIAFSNGVGLVDIFAAMVAGACPSSAVSGFPGLRGPTFHLSFPCIGVDHVHPTPEGYEVMADAFLDAIVNQYDIQVAGTRESRRPGSPLAGER